MILRHEPTFFAGRIPFLKHRGLATPLSRILRRLIDSDRVTTANIDTWQQSWIESILTVLRRGDDTLRGNVIIYLLPNLFQQSIDAARALLRAISRGYNCQKLDLGTVITCLALAKEAQAIPTINARFLASIELSYTIIQDALTTADDSLRAASFNMLVTCRKTTLPFPREDFVILTRTIPSFIRESNPDRRKLLLTVFDKLLRRLSASILHIATTTKNSRTSASKLLVNCDDYVSYALKFLTWLSMYLNSLIEPGTGYQNTILYLSILSGARK